MKMNRASLSSFAIGRRWRVEGNAPRRYRGLGMEFVIIGKGNTSSKLCRTVVDEHQHNDLCACGHGRVAIWTHAHLKRHFTLLPVDAPAQDALELPPG